MEIVVAIILVAAGALVAVSGRLTATGRIKRNGFVGIRTRSSTADDEAWLIVHRRAQPWLIAAGVVLAVTGVLTAAAPGTSAVLIAGMVLTCVLALAGTAFGHAALRHRGLPR